MGKADLRHVGADVAQLTSYMYDVIGSDTVILLVDHSSEKVDKKAAEFAAQPQDNVFAAEIRSNYDLPADLSYPTKFGTNWQGLLQNASKYGSEIVRADAPYHLTPKYNRDVKDAIYNLSPNAFQTYKAELDRSVSNIAAGYSDEMIKFQDYMSSDMPLDLSYEEKLVYIQAIAEDYQKINDANKDLIKKYKDDFPFPENRNYNAAIKDSDRETALLTNEAARFLGLDERRLEDIDISKSAKKERMKVSNEHVVETLQDYKLEKEHAGERIRVMGAFGADHGRDRKDLDEMLEKKGFGGSAKHVYNVDIVPVRYPQLDGQIFQVDKAEPADFIVTVFDPNAATVLKAEGLYNIRDAAAKIQFPLTDKVTEAVSEKPVNEEPLAIAIPIITQPTVQERDKLESEDKNPSFTLPVFKKPAQEGQPKHIATPVNIEESTADKSNESISPSDLKQFGDLIKGR